MPATAADPFTVTCPECGSAGSVTLHLAVKVYEALTPGNRERFGKPDRLVDFSWRMAA